eukprot:3814446-Rhodomonas_salina.1
MSQRERLSSCNSAISHRADWTRVQATMLSCCHRCNFLASTVGSFATCNRRVKTQESTRCIDARHLAPSRIGKELSDCSIDTAFAFQISDTTVPEILMLHLAADFIDVRTQLLGCCPNAPCWCREICIDGERICCDEDLALRVASAAQSGRASRGGLRPIAVGLIQQAAFRRRCVI